MNMMVVVYDMLRSCAHDLSRMLSLRYGLDVCLDNVVSDSLQAAASLPVVARHPTLCLADIKQAYDRMPIDIADPQSIPGRLKFILALVLRDLEPDVKFWVRRSPAADGSCLRWLVSLQPDRIRGRTAVAVDQLPILAHLLLSHCFVHGLGTYWRTATGCPQGLAPGPVFINAHLLSYDLQFVMTRHATPVGRFQIQQLYSCQRKLIDDVMVLGGLGAAQLLQQVYPPYVELEFSAETTGADPRCGSGLTQ